jgi:hypothetical protein
MHAHVFGHFNLGLILIALFYALMLRASAMETDELEKLLVQGLWDAINAAHLSIKEAAYYMKLDESQLRKQLRCEPGQQLALVRVFRLPFSVWMFFAPCMMSLVYKKRLSEFNETAVDFNRKVS